jgi:3-oxoacyl-[acyl-carrier-protein] synthase-3
MTKAKIDRIAYYLPPDILGNEELASRFPEWSMNKVTDKTGINIRHRSGGDEFVSDMAIESCRCLFEKYTIDPKTIDFLLLCTQSPDYFLPSTSCIVQEKLGLKTSCGAFDFNLGCSGYIYGLGVAKGLIETNQATHVLLVTSETYTEHIAKNDRSNLSIFGDAAAATLISSSDKECLHSFVFGTDGKGADKLIVRNGAMRHPRTIQGASGEVDEENYLHMDGPEIFSFTLLRVPEVVHQTLAKANLSLNQIDLFVFHQANKFMLEHIRKKIGIDADRFCFSMSEVGNTVSSTIPIALAKAIDEGRLYSGMKALLVGFGVGYSWGACILEMNEEDPWILTTS